MKNTMAVLCLTLIGSTTLCMEDSRAGSSRQVRPRVQQNQVVQYVQPIASTQGVGSSQSHALAQGTHSQAIQPASGEGPGEYVVARSIDPRRAELISILDGSSQQVEGKEPTSSYDHACWHYAVSGPMFSDAQKLAQVWEQLYHDRQSLQCIPRGKPIGYQKGEPIRIVITAVRNLMNKNLLIPENTCNGLRYRIPPTIMDSTVIGLPLDLHEVEDTSSNQGPMSMPNAYTAKPVLFYVSNVSNENAKDAELAYILHFRQISRGNDRLTCYVHLFDQKNSRNNSEITGDITIPRTATDCIELKYEFEVDASGKGNVYRRE